MKVLELIVARCAEIRNQALIFGVFVLIVCCVFARFESGHGNHVLAGMLYGFGSVVVMICLGLYAYGEIRGLPRSAQEGAFEQIVNKEIYEHRRRKAANLRRKPIKAKPDKGSTHGL